MVFPVKELDCLASDDSAASFLSLVFKSNEVSKSEGIRKVEYRHHF